MIGAVGLAAITFAVAWFVREVPLRSRQPAGDSPRGNQRPADRLTPLLRPSRPPVSVPSGRERTAQPVYRRKDFTVMPKEALSPSS